MRLGQKAKRYAQLGTFFVVGLTLLAYERVLLFLGIGMLCCGRPSSSRLGQRVSSTSNEKALAAGQSASGPYPTFDPINGAVFNADQSCRLFLTSSFASRKTRLRLLNVTIQICDVYLDCLNTSPQNSSEMATSLPHTKLVSRHAHKSQRR